MRKIMPIRYFDLCISLTLLEGVSSSYCNDDYYRCYHHSNKSIVSTSLGFIPETINLSNQRQQSSGGLKKKSSGGGCC
jgi:hypothetical protein